MKKSFLTLSLGAVALLLSACNNNGTISKGSYTLTLMANGGTFSGSTTKVYTNAGTISAASALTTPTKAATTNYTYTFNGWYDGKSSSSNAITFPYTLSADTTFYAHWSETATQKYTVTFDANGGTFSDGTSSCYLSTAKVRKNDASAIVPTKTGYEFLGWWFTTTEKNDPVSFPYVPTADITIHAMWSNSPVTITLNPDGGTFTDGTTGTKSLTDQYVADYSEIEKPTKTISSKNYNFVGWGVKQGGTSICSGKQILDSDLTLYAIWSDPSSSDFAIYTDSTASYTKSGSEYSFNTAGEYTLTGNLSSGNIIINPSDGGTVTVNMNGCSISSASDIPIYIGDYADKVKIKAVESTTNYIYDNRTVTNESVDGGAIYSLADLDLVGKGSLHIEGNKNNGVHCKADLSIKNQTLYVKGANHAIRGNNSITIESGNITAVAVGGDGLKTSDSGTSKTGKQKGNIEIYGGSIDIDSYGDGIQAAYDTIIESSYDDDGNEVVPSIDIKTYKYAETGGETPTTSTLYIRSTTNYTSSSGTSMYVVSTDTDDKTHTETATYSGTETVTSDGGMGPGGGSKTTTYYVWTLARPSTYKNFYLRIGSSTSSYTYYTNTTTYNSSYNMITLSKSSFSNKLSVNWGVHDASSDLSAKGIKAENTVNIYNSEVNIKAFGNGIHANADSTIESTSSYGNGTINICDGTITIYSDNKGAHADNYLNVTGGNAYVTNAYEGYEASQINVSGGQTHIYATDDGFNAGSKDSSITNKQINVTGGYVDIQTTSGDTDGIDSNGTFTQTGGIVVSRASTNNEMSTALDTDGQSTISGSAVFVAVGAQAEADRENRLTCNNKSSVSKSFSANTSYTINSTYTFTVTMGYSLYYYYLGSSASAPTIK